MNYYQSTKKESGGSALSETLIWENSDTTQSISSIASTPLDTDLTQYDYIKLTYYIDTANNTELSIIVPLGADGRTYLTMSTYLSIGTYNRYVSLSYNQTIDDYLMYVSQCAQLGSNAGVGQYNSSLIPKQVIGLKGTI